MKKLLLLLLLSISSLECTEKAVTYTFSGGRFGDNILSYAHAKWISHLHGIPVLYQPFPYSDQLVLHDIEPLYQSDALDHFQETVTLGYDKEVDTENGLSTLYVLPYFGESSHERSLNPSWPFVQINWQDPDFRVMLKETIQPKNSLPKWELPTDRVTVAMHVRRGGGFDSPDAQKLEPLRFPPDVFYIEQLKYIYQHLGQTPLYIFLFTDDAEPQEIVKRYQDALEGCDITFDYRTAGNSHNANVLEDCFAMAQFDCLIRPQSNYSRVASLIGDFIIEIYPTEFAFINDTPSISQYEIHTRGN